MYGLGPHDYRAFIERLNNEINANRVPWVALISAIHCTDVFKRRMAILNYYNIDIIAALNAARKNNNIMNDPVTTKYIDSVLSGELCRHHYPSIFGFFRCTLPEYIYKLTSR